MTELEAERRVIEAARRAAEDPFSTGDFRLLEEALAALSAAGLVVEQGWQPEDTAPTDNKTPIMLLGHDGRCIIPDAFTVGRHPERPMGQRFVGYWLHNGVHERSEFVAWRPLPAPPTQETNDGP